MTICICIDTNGIYEVDLDLSNDPTQNQLYSFLDGSATFLGKWELSCDEDIIIITTNNNTSSIRLSNIRLPSPFDDMILRDKTVLVKTDEDVEPTDLTLESFKKEFPLWNIDNHDQHS